MIGIIILGSGIGLIILSGGFLIVSMVYRKTAGRKILEDLKKEYE